MSADYRRRKELGEFDSDPKVAERAAARINKERLEQLEAQQEEAEGQEGTAK